MEIKGKREEKEDKNPGEIERETKKKRKGGGD